jgi:hypothetical protein
VDKPSLSISQSTASWRSTGFGAYFDKRFEGIPLQSGFYDHSHLSRVFSKVMGISPSAYRKAHDSKELSGK